MQTKNQSDPPNQAKIGKALIREANNITNRSNELDDLQKIKFLACVGVGYKTVFDLFVGFKGCLVVVLDLTVYVLLEATMQDLTRVTQMTNFDDIRGHSNVM